MRCTNQPRCVVLRVLIWAVRRHRTRRRSSSFAICSKSMRYAGKCSMRSTCIWAVAAFASQPSRLLTRRSSTRPRRPRTRAGSATRRCIRRRRATNGVCHEHERKLVMLYRRWETASRSRLAGAGFKPPGAAAFRRRGGERPRKRHRQRCQVSIEEMSESKLSDDASLLPQNAVRTGDDHWLQDKSGRDLFTVPAAVGV
jgi:hypothetical protein